MAMARRGDGDREALRDYVGTYETALEAWRAVPGLDVKLDRPSGALPVSPMPSTGATKAPTGKRLRGG